MEDQVEVIGALGDLGVAGNGVAIDAQDAVSEVSNSEVGVSDLELRVRKCANKVDLLNNIMGNVPVIDRDPALALRLLTQQEKVFNEERNEVFEALRHKCYVEVLDGLSDVFVVAQGFGLLNRPVAIEDVEAGKIDTVYAGHVGSVVHSQGVGALSNVMRESFSHAFDIARIEAERLFIQELGIAPEVYLEATVKALELVCENNLSKATDDVDVAHAWLEGLTEKQLVDEGYHIRSSEVSEVIWYALFDKNGKFRKHNNFVGVDLQPVVDELLQGVNPDLLVDQELAYEGFKRAMGGK